jgi:hypothetical protein
MFNSSIFGDALNLRSPNIDKAAENRHPLSGSTLDCELAGELRE